MARKIEFVWMNGEFVEMKEANIHFLAPACLAGRIAFDVAPYYEGDHGQVYIFRLSDHIERLFRTCKIFRMEIPYTKEKFIKACIQTARKNEVHGNGIVLPEIYEVFDPERPTYWVGEAAPTKVLIACLPRVGKPYFYPEELEKGIKCMISSWRRLSINSCPPSGKMRGNYLSVRLARKEAQDYGVHEAIFLDHRGFVSEAATATIFYVYRHGDIVKLYTPPVYASILPSITRDAVITLAKELGYQVMERDVARDELYCADEVFTTGSSQQIMPVVEIDHRTIGDGKVGEITKKIQEIYFDVVKGKSKIHLDWLTPIY